MNIKTNKTSYAKVLDIARNFNIYLFLLFFLGAYSSVNAHGVQTGWCFAPNGDDIRIYIEHWHGPGQDVDCGAGATINISVAINGGAEQYFNNLSFNSNIPGTLATLPRDSNLPIQVISACSDANSYNDWGSWDFPIPEGLCPEGGSINITVLSANDCVFSEGCSQLYPASTNTIITPADCPCGPGLPGVDNDGDGWIDICDCDDNNPNINPGISEICGNGIDDDCDGTIDFIDKDGDGSDFCSGADCDDNNATVYPGAPELCDGLDNDCDGVGDVDNDGDGSFVCEGDCDDNDPSVYPGAPELCDTLDNNCNGIIDEVDLDGDGHTAPGACSGTLDDCDDNDPTVYPGAPELCDGKDNDCDGMIESSTGYNLGLADINIPSMCAPGNHYNDCSSDLMIQWTSTNVGMSDGSLEIAIGVVCDGNTPRAVFLNGVVQDTIMPIDACTCTPDNAQSFTLDLNPADYISGGLNVVTIEANGTCFGLLELDGFGSGVFANACISYCVDPDLDEVCGDADNCPSMANADQADADGDGIGDVCDVCPFDADNDIDGDGVCGDVDNCPETANSDQADTDGDGLGDTCDDCPLDPENDIDNDTVCGDVDNCMNLSNKDQADTDGDGIGDVCDAFPTDALNDIDGDGVSGDIDLCPFDYDPDQLDSDCDGVGDICDICAGGDDTVDNNADGIPDCSQALDIDDYSDDWKCGNNNNKVKLCHVPPGNPNNPQELCVSVNSIPSHLANHEGDAVGPCTSCAEQSGLATQGGNVEARSHSHGSPELSVYPNPANSEIKLLFNSEEDALVNIYMTDIWGKIVMVEKQNVVHGENEFMFAINDIAEGIYFISMQVGDEIHSLRFVKFDGK